MAMTPVVIALGASGAATARRIAADLDAPLHGRAGRVEGADATFAQARDHVATLFAAGHPVVGVCASGILIRAVAPLLADKRAEPPVLAVSDDGSSVVPLLGGHRGANALALRIAATLGGQAALTTAGEVRLGAALDAPPAGHRLVNPQDAAPAMAALLAGAGARLSGPALFALPHDPAGGVEIAVTEAPLPGGPGRLVYHPQRHVLGVGCARDAAPEELAALVEGVLAEAGIAPGALAAIATLDLKADEPAVLALAAGLGLPLRLFDAAALEAEAARLASPSEVVFAEVGCHGVAEGAALAAAGPAAVLAVAKRKSGAATCALARAPAPIVAPFGRPRGRVSLVGIGPGQAAWRTPEASRLIAEADELVGYGLYLDLLGPLGAGKARTEFPLGGEAERCRYALEEAGRGRDIALICSGDAGIYAMGALVHELLDGSAGGPGGAGSGGALSDAACRVEVVTAPGITAMQAAAARAGAPLGHDFCAISLSDLLTPRDTILRRVRAAADGDFVVAFYNPVSRRRRTLLAEARELLRAHRPDDTPVLLAASLGRPGESLRHRRLAELDVDEVDMLTLVIVGAAETRLLRRGEGPRIYTPRGYAAKSADGRGNVDLNGPDRLQRSGPADPA